MRGFYTDPSRADDSFIPFSSGLKLLWSQEADGNNTAWTGQTLVFDELVNYSHVMITCCTCNNAGNGMVKDLCSYVIPRDSNVSVGHIRTAVSTQPYISRSFNFTGNSIIISNENYSGDNRYVYPLAIYGLNI